MLTDLERKIYQILYNYSLARRRMPSMQELMNLDHIWLDRFSFFEFDIMLTSITF
ncbi:hypothetical protein SAMN05428961_110133 [Paenibacillus sp. OK060]|nr:hypothetical protein SAMN05428961_110133 [Paenibacillus sp. OK060]